LRFDSTTLRITGIPTPAMPGVFPVSAIVRQMVDGATITKEETFTITVARSDTPLHNRPMPEDVDGNGRVEAIDAPRIINYIASYGGGSAFAHLNDFRGFVDTSGDNIIGPLDALRVINRISIQRRTTAGLAEKIERPQQATDAAIDSFMKDSAIF